MHALLERFPHVGRVYWLMTNLDAAIHREWTVSLGRRSALSRMAHLFCEILERLKIVGLNDGASYEFPLTQQELSECLGLTAVHVNRTLQELRKRGLIEVKIAAPLSSTLPAQVPRRVRSLLSLPRKASPLIYVIFPALNLSQIKRVNSMRCGMRGD